jgi:hypothetical protein
MTDKQKRYIDWIESMTEISFENSGLSVSEYIEKYADSAKTQFELDGIIQASYNGG